MIREGEINKAFPDLLSNISPEIKMSSIVFLILTLEVDSLLRRDLIFQLTLEKIPIAAFVILLFTTEI